MSIHADAQVRLILADFANTDLGGKLNIVGGGISFIGSAPHGGSSAFSLAVITTVPAKHAGQQFALSLELYDETRKRVVQGPGPSGVPQAMRVQQMVPVQHLQLPPDVQTPTDAEVQNLMVMNFSEGFPLEPGTYDWKAQIDGQARPSWYTRFHVLAPAQGPIFGGPVGPSNIGGIPQPFTPLPDDPDKPAT